MHPNTWDENIIYIQHSYNRAIHTSTSKYPFKTCFGYLLPSPLDVVYGKQRGVRENFMGEALTTKKFVEKNRWIHLQVHKTLKKSQERYKA
jgi:hypothetical protein